MSICSCLSFCTVCLLCLGSRCQCGSGLIAAYWSCGVFCVFERGALSWFVCGRGCVSVLVSCSCLALLFVALFLALCPCYSASSRVSFAGVVFSGPWSVPVIVCTVRLVVPLYNLTLVLISLFYGPFCFLGSPCLLPLELAFVLCFVVSSAWPRSLLARFVLVYVR